MEGKLDQDTALKQPSVDSQSPSNEKSSLPFYPVMANPTMHSHSNQIHDHSSALKQDKLGSTITNTTCVDCRSEFVKNTEQLVCRTM